MCSRPAVIVTALPDPAERASHDALIQGLQGLILHLQTIADGMSPLDPAHAQLTLALVRADGMLSASLDDIAAQARLPALHLGALTQAMAGLGRDLAQGPQRLSFRLVVGGEPRGLRAAAQDAAIQIAREALFNALAHAHSRKVSVDLQFGRRALRLRIRDDGVGLLPGSEPGPGWTRMRGCARRTGAVLQVWSRPRRGTQVLLEVPAARAYAWRPAAGWQVALRRALEGLS